MSASESVPTLSVLPILSTPLGLVHSPKAQALNAALTAVFAERVRSDRSSGRGTGFSYHSADDLLEWPDPPVRDLSAEILRGVYSVIDAVNAFPEGQLRSFTCQARAWFSVVQRHGSVPATNHALTAWCAVYCVAAPEPAPGRADSGVLRLHESRLGTMFQDATNSTMRVPYTPGHFVWRPVPGHLAVFPGSLTHEIALLHSVGELILVTARIRFVAPGQQGMSRW